MRENSKTGKSNVDEDIAEIAGISYISEQFHNNNKLALIFSVFYSLL